MDPLTIYKGSSGLNTKVDKTRVRFDPETGVSDLTRAVNVTHDDTGMVSRRKVSSLLTAGGFHSLFAGNNECYLGEGAYLYRVENDFSISGVRDGMSGNRIDFTVTPLGIYYMNGMDFGILNEGRSFTWVQSEYVGPTTTKKFTGPPVGQHLELFLGYMLIARGNVLWWSMPFAYGLYHMAACYLPFPSRIRMVKAVAGGVYVSDENRTYFLAGKDPAEWERKTVSDHPALEWSDNHELIPAKEFGLDIEDMQCAAWVDQSNGPCYGTDQGQVMTLNPGNKIVYPEVLQQGAGLLMGHNFIHAMT